MTAQDVPSSQLGNRGLDITLSSLVNSQHLRNHAGPLPMLQIHEFANSDNQGPFRLWTVSRKAKTSALHTHYPLHMVKAFSLSKCIQASPFDVSLMNGAP